MMGDDNEKGGKAQNAEGDQAHEEYGGVGWVDVKRNGLVQGGMAHGIWSVQVCNQNRGQVTQICSGTSRGQETTV